MAELTGVEQGLLIEAARAYASQKPAALFFSTSRSVEPGAVIARAAANLGLITGNVGKASAGVNPLRSDANSQGTTDMGCVPSMLPGHVSMADGSDAPFGSRAQLWRDGAGWCPKRTAGAVHFP